MHLPLLVFVLYSCLSTFVVETRPLGLEVLAYQGGKKLAEMFLGRNAQTQVQPAYTQPTPVTYVLSQPASVYQQPFQQRSLLESSTVPQAEQFVQLQPQTEVQQPDHTYYTSSEQVHPLQAVQSVSPQTYQVQIQPQAHTVQYMPRALAALTGRPILQPTLLVEPTQPVVHLPYVVQQPQTVVHLPHVVQTPQNVIHLPFVGQPQTVEQLPQVPHVVQHPQTFVHLPHVVQQPDSIVQQPGQSHYTSSAQTLQQDPQLNTPQPTNRDKLDQPTRTHTWYSFLTNPKDHEDDLSNFRQYIDLRQNSPERLAEFFDKEEMERYDYWYKKNYPEQSSIGRPRNRYSYRTDPQDHPDDFNRFQEYSSMRQISPERLSQFFEKDEIQRYSHWFDKYYPH